MRTAAYNDGTASDHRRRQNVLGHILAPAVVACDIIIVRRSAHPAGGFFIIRKCIS